MKLWILALSITVGTSLVQDGYRYQSEDYGMLEVAGVCSYNAEEVNCWDPKGNPNPKLSELISAYFIANPSMQMSFRFKRRNQIIAMRSVSKQGAKVTFEGELDGSTGLRARPFTTIGSTEGEESYKLFWYNPSEEDRTTDLTVGLNNQLRSESTLEAKEGSAIKMGDFVVKITGISEASGSERQAAVYPLKNRVWKVAFSITGPISKGLPQLQAFPMDAKGLPIAAVDINGNPALLDEGGGSVNYFSYQLFAGGYSQSGNIGIWYSKIRPDKIKHLVVSGHQKRKVVFKNVALEPLISY